MAGPTSSPVAIVTGASSGIGAATARRLARAGFVVYGAARRADRLAELGDGVRPLVLDVTDDASMVAGVEQVLEEHGRVDVLVGNAGYGSYGSVEEVPLDEARRQLETNVIGLARMIQLVLPTMRAQGSGRIINVSSMGGRFAGPFGGWYHASKFALEGLSDSLRAEVAPFGIRVSVVEPGAIKTEWGGIATDSAVEVSGDGPYAERVRRMAKGLSSGIERIASSPDVVAKAIEHAATADRPRIRYAIGAGAKPATFAARVLPARVLDALVSRGMG